MAKKAKALRLKMGDDNYYAPIERKETKSMGKRVEDIVARPFQVFIQEPMLMAITLYMSVRNSIVSRGHALIEYSLSSFMEPFTCCSSPFFTA